MSVEILPSFPGLSFLSRFPGSIQNQFFFSVNPGLKRDTGLTNLDTSPIYLISIIKEIYFSETFKQALTHLPPKDKAMGAALCWGNSSTYAVVFNQFIHLAHSISADCCFFINDEGMKFECHSQYNKLCFRFS